MVEDASGSQFAVYEFQARGWLKHRKLMLENGEPVHKHDATHFIIVRTGEVLLRVDD